MCKNTKVGIYFNRDSNFNLAWCRSPNPFYRSSPCCCI